MEYDTYSTLQSSLTAYHTTAEIWPNNKSLPEAQKQQGYQLTSWERRRQEIDI